MATMKLTNTLLKRIIEEEVSKFGKEKPTEDAVKDTEEVDADEFADTLEKDIDYVKALKIEESRLRKRYKKIQQEKRKVAVRIIKDA